MDHFAGLDVSVKETSVCIVDEMGKIVREVKLASEPEALLAVLANPAYHFKRIGLEAGPLSQWLYGVLAEAGLPVICVETRHMRAVLKAQINKTDRNDVPFASSAAFNQDHQPRPRQNPRSRLQYFVDRSPCRVSWSQRAPSSANHGLPSLCCRLPRY
jgi:hypothetical protein